MANISRSISFHGVHHIGVHQRISEDGSTYWSELIFHGDDGDIQTVYVFTRQPRHPSIEIDQRGHDDA